MRIFSKTDCGKVRKINQDAFFATVLPDGAALAVVCDGMGGANAGDLASKTAVEVISQYIINAYSTSMDTNALLNLIKNSIISANIDVYDISLKNSDLSGMGTTAVVAVVREKQVIICNVGDSRAYLLSDKLKQITRDHSVVQTLLESGKLTEEEARVHPDKNVITRALGVEENIIPDDYCIPLQKGEYILLCTDGLSNYVDSETIYDIVKNNDINKVTQLLVDKANSAGGRDNVTVVAVTH